MVRMSILLCYNVIMKIFIILFMNLLIDIMLIKCLLIFFYFKRYKNFFFMVFDILSDVIDWCFFIKLINFIKLIIEYLDCYGNKWLKFLMIF